ncbi:MAG: class I SAM-dependent methyltransferase [Desulfomonile tiedjei]|nr:class I SAM-dependent methyltransferase [Desulfomonile tiedjei]
MQALLNKFRTRLKYAHFPYIKDVLLQAGNDGTQPRRILDVGCGPGHIGLFCGASPSWRWFGLDLWEHELRQAEARGVYEGLFQVNLLDGLPFRDASFDTILCSEVLMYLPNHRELLADFHRALRPDGMVFIHNPISWVPATFARLKQWIRRIHQESDSVSFDTQTEWKHARRACRVTYYSLQSLVDEINAAHFDILDVRGFRIFRNRIRLMNRLEDFPWYHHATQAVTGRFPAVASDVLVVGRKRPVG